jgi:hypothetical protein
MYRVHLSKDTLHEGDHLKKIEMEEEEMDRGEKSTGVNGPM